MAFKSLSNEDDGATACANFFELTSVYVENISTNSDPKDANSYFESSYDELDASIEIMELILASVPSSGALARLIAYILEQRGPLPVGRKMRFRFLLRQIL